MRRFRNIPPLQYLVGFEAAARLGGFSRAASELGLSQSAVSHEMRLLEDRIGQPLFMRKGRSVHLTDAGRDYQRSVMKSLALLEEGHRRLAPFRKAGSVVIYAPRDFTARWLMPRLWRLRQEIPGCEPWIDTSGSKVDFIEIEASIAILRDAAPPANLECLTLFPDSLTPVAAPARATALRAPADVLNGALIHHERAEGWSDWFQLAGVDGGNLTAGLDFSDSDFALAAAELGLGTALGCPQLVSGSVAAGQLCQPFSQTLDTGQWWLATSTVKELSDPVTAKVWQWLKDEAGAIKRHGQ